MRLLPSRSRRRLSPSVQLAAAGLIMVGGAWLISVVVVGVVIMLEALFFVVVVWDDGKPKDAGRQDRVQSVLEGWRQAR